MHVNCLNTSEYTSEMTAYIVKGEILDSKLKPFLESIGSKVEPIGEQKYLLSQSDSSVDKHSMDIVIEALKGSEY